jgi:predicted small integral membrane protein
MSYVTILREAHSGWRWLVLLIVVITLTKMLVGWLGKQQWRTIDDRLLLATRVTVYIQVLLGVILYIFLQQWFNLRFTAEHVIIALLSVGGVEFAAARAKKAEGAVNKFKFAAIGLIIASVLIYVALLAVGGLFAT